MIYWPCWSMSFWFCRAFPWRWSWRMIFFEIFHNERAIVAAGFVGTAIYVILAAPGLEFLGLGDVTVIDWGTMFYWAQNNDALLLGAWWWYVAPGMCIALLGAGLALINFGIDEVANPRLRREIRRVKKQEEVQEGRKIVRLNKTTDDGRPIKSL